MWSLMTTGKGLAPWSEAGCGAGALQAKEKEQMHTGRDTRSPGPDAQHGEMVSLRAPRPHPHHTPLCSLGQLDADQRGLGSCSRR